jgi:DNA-binding SARP family transcriptional activator
LELDPNYTTAYLRLGNAYAMKAQWSEAIAAYEKVKQTPDKICIRRRTDLGRLRKPSAS